MTNIKDKLTLRLKQIGMTQRELAKKVEVTEATVSRYVKGEREPNEEMISKIADAIDVSPEYFSDVSDNKVDDLEQIHSLIARNEKVMTAEEKLAIIKLLSGR